MFPKCPRLRVLELQALSSVSEEQKEIEDDVHPAVDLEWPVKEQKEEVADKKLHSRTVLMAQNQEPNETTLQLPLEKSGSEEMAGVQFEGLSCEGLSEISEENGPMHMDNNSVVVKLEDLPQGEVAKELAAASEEQTGTSITGAENNEVMDSFIWESASKVAVPDDSYNAAEVPERNLLNELPVGVIDIEESLEHEQAEQLENASNLLNELPVGVIDIEDPLEHELAEHLENVSLLSGDVEERGTIDALNQQTIEGHGEGDRAIDNTPQVEEVSDVNEPEQQSVLVHDEEPIETDTSSPDIEISIQNELEQQPVEIFENDEMGSKSNDYLHEKLLPGEDVQQTQAIKVNNTEHADESQLEKTRQVPILLQENRQDNETQKESSQGNINIDSSIILDTAHLGDNNHDVDQPTGEDVDEGTIQEQRESVGEKRTATTEPFIEEREIAIEDGRKLVEENEKMREMVEKLIKSGKEQLAVISSLSDRVKDLEKKLRKKKMRARRIRTARSSPSP